MGDTMQPDGDGRELEARVREANAFVPALRDEMGSVLVGQDRLVRSLLVGLLTNGNVLVEGVPGLAKTLAIRVLAQTVGGAFTRLQFTPDLLPADLVGTMVYNPKDQTFSAKKGPVFANLILADEINRAPAKVQSALLEAMQEHQVSIGGETFPLPEPFLVMATQNPIEHEGTYALPEAQIDRFMLKVEITYPDRAQERDVIQRMAHPAAETDAKQVVTLEEIVAARAVVDAIHIDSKVGDYILDLVIATRPACRNQLSELQNSTDLSGLETMIEHGASPRAGLALTLAAKALAFMEGRAYVMPQDVKDMAPEVLRHRIIPTYEAEAEDLTTNDLVQRLLSQIRTP